MPLISLSTNLTLERAQEMGIAKHLSVLTSAVIGKPEQWVMTHVNSQQSMIFAASDAPCAYLECKSIGLTDAQIPPLAAALCALLQHELQLDPARVYIEFSAAQPQHWGWNGSTF